jgi:hypothetical protein
MEDYTMQNNKSIRNGLIILERARAEMARLKVDRITDTLLWKHLDYYDAELDKVSITIKQNPRFEWVKIQEEIDGLYSIDPNLTGMILYLDWKDGGNRGFLKHRIKSKR